jgi:hypothetical protein
MEFKDVFAALGLGTPFMLAAVTYGLFYWLDRNASAQATGAISGWLKGEEYRRIDIRPAIIAVFDRIYRCPLLTLKAFFRSVKISLAVWMGYSFVYNQINPSNKADLSNPNVYVSDWVTIALLMLLFVIIADYISLFIVRKCLTFGGNRLVLPLMIAFCSGFLAICLIFTLVIVTLTTLIMIGHGKPDQIGYALRIMFNGLLENHEKLLANFAPALLVHLWLLLFAMGALGVRFVFPIFRVITWAQWFLKQGDQHPMRAIGMVAAALMFFGGAIWKTVTAI